MANFTPCFANSTAVAAPIPELAPKHKVGKIFGGMPIESHSKFSIFTQYKLSMSRRKT